MCFQSMEMFKEIFGFQVCSNMYLSSCGEVRKEMLFLISEFFEETSNLCELEKT